MYYPKWAANVSFILQSANTEMEFEEVITISDGIK